jgi:hypothetical protein
VSVLDGLPVFGGCEDGGTCHHHCDEKGHSCFRRDHCSPLSGVFPGDVWPKASTAANGRAVSDRTAPDVAQEVSWLVLSAMETRSDVTGGADVICAIVPPTDATRIDLVLPDGTRVSLRVESVW